MKTMDVRDRWRTWQGLEDVRTSDKGCRRAWQGVGGEPE